MQAKSVVRLEETSSVLNDLARLAKDGAPEGTVVVARRQTGGRGRMGRSFCSEPGGLYMAYLLRPAAPVSALTPLTALCGSAVCSAVESLTGIRPRAKWPNDVMLGGRKLCGILAEASLRGEYADYVAVGIGVNLNQTSFPPPLTDTAVSLFQAYGREYEPEEALDAVISEISKVMHILGRDPLGGVERYRADCETPGKRVRAVRGNTVFEGVAQGIDDDARLLLLLDDGKTEVIDSGTIETV